MPGPRTTPSQSDGTKTIVDRQILSVYNFNLFYEKGDSINNRPIPS